MQRHIPVVTMQTLGDLGSNFPEDSAQVGVECTYEHTHAHARAHTQNGVQLKSKLQHTGI